MTWLAQQAPAPVRLPQNPHAVPGPLWAQLVVAAVVLWLGWKFLSWLLSHEDEIR